MYIFRKISFYGLIVGALAITASTFAEAPVVNLTENGYQDLAVANQIPTPQNEAPGAQADTTTLPTNALANAPAASAASPLAERVDVLENQMRNLTRMDLLGKIAALQQQVQKLTGALEVAQRDQAKLAQQQRDFYRDIDTRLVQLAQAKPVQVQKQVIDKKPTATREATPPPKASVSAQATPKHQPRVSASAKEQEAYRVALVQLKRRQVDQAKVSFESYLKRFPKGEYAVNAHYWLGELYSIDKDNKHAIEQFNIVIKQYPDSSKADDALLKLGFIHASEGNIDLAKKQLQQVVKQYPDSTAARLAALKLRSLKNQPTKKATEAKTDTTKSTTTAESAKAEGS